MNPSVAYWIKHHVLIAGGSDGFEIVLAKLLNRFGDSVTDALKAIRKRATLMVKFST